MIYNVTYLGCEGEYDTGLADRSDVEQVEATDAHAAIKAWNRKRRCQPGQYRHERYRVEPVSQSYTIELVRENEEPSDGIVRVEVDAIRAATL